MIALNASPALALNPIELTDQRVTNKEGLQLIYEVRLTTPRQPPRLLSETAWFRSLFYRFLKLRSDSSTHSN